MKDVPASDETQNEIICWTRRHDPSDAFISNQEKNSNFTFGSIIGTSSIRKERKYCT